VGAAGIEHPCKRAGSLGRSATGPPPDDAIYASGYLRGEHPLRRPPAPPLCPISSHLGSSRALANIPGEGLVPTASSGDGGFDVEAQILDAYEARHAIERIGHRLRQVPDGWLPVEARC
jgi:hypothetical protein